MPPTAVDWVPGLMALALGLLSGAFLLWSVRARPRPAAADGTPPLAERDLLAQRDALLVQLRELEDTASKRTPEQLARERYALELEAARVLLDLDGRAAAGRPGTRRGAKAQARAVAAAGPAAAVPAGRPALRGFLWGVGSMAAVGLLLFLVSQAARTREQGATATGDIGPPGAQQGQAGAPADPRVAAIQERLQRNPDDLDARLDMARADLARQDMMGVWNETQYILARSPDHPEATSYQALVRMAMGQPETAETMLKGVIAKKPELLDAHLHLTLVYARMGRLKEAEATMAEAQRRFPDRAQELGALMAEIRTRASRPGETRPRQAEAQRPGAPSAAPEPAAASGRGVAGTVDLAPALKGKVAPGTTVWVTVREAGVEKGPPAAVKRLAAGAFPLRFSITDADSMAGEPLPDPLRIEARVDSDGNPVTRSPDDPSARADGVRVGTKDIRLVLGR